MVLTDSIFTLANFQTALSTGTSSQAFVNSLILSRSLATIGVPIIGILTWIIYRSKLRGRVAIEYVVMFPQAMPRLIFGLRLLWIWIKGAVPIYGTLWLLGLLIFIASICELGVSVFLMGPRSKVMVFVAVIPLFALARRRTGATT